MHALECVWVGDDTTTWVCICLCVHVKAAADCNLEFKGYLVSTDVLPCFSFAWHSGYLAVDCVEVNVMVQSFTLRN